MPDFEHCVKDRNKIYCWNDETGEVEEFTVRKIPIADCPNRIARALMRCQREKGENGK